MQEIGIVTSTEGPMAKVLVKKGGVCEKCTMGTCELKDDGAEITAFNSVKATKGQRVKVVMKSYTYLKGSMMIYGLPLVTLIAGAVVGKELVAPEFPGFDPDMMSAIVGFGALGVSFVFIKLWSARAQGDIEYKPVIEEILK